MGVSDIATDRRRADAERNVETILETAVSVLGQRPEASIAEIAAAAGVTRQTVYAHYSSRRELILAVVNRAIERLSGALDALELESGPPADALLRVVDAGWLELERHLRLRSLPDAPSPSDLDAGHNPITARLERLIRRGQRDGTFHRDVSAAWLASAMIGLFHVAADQVSAGQLTRAQAVKTLRATIPRLVSVSQK